MLMKNLITQQTNRVLSLTQLLARKQQNTISRAKVQKYNNSSITQKTPVALPTYNSSKQQVPPTATRATGSLRPSRATYLLKGSKTRSGSGQLKAQKSIKPLIPGKSCSFFVNDKREKSSFSRRLIDYKNTGLLQYYISTGGKLLPRRQTRLTAKQQRFIAKTVKSARVMCLLPFVSKDRSPYPYSFAKTSSGGSVSY